MVHVTDTESVLRMLYVVGEHISQRFYLWRQKKETINEGRRQGRTYARGHRTKRAVVGLPLNNDLVPSNVQLKTFKLLRSSIYCVCTVPQDQVLNSSIIVILPFQPF